MLGIYTFQSGRRQEGRPHSTGECRKGRQWDGGGSPMGGGGENRTEGGSRYKAIWGERGSHANFSGLSETDREHIQNELQIQHKELMSYNNRIAIFPVPSLTHFQC